MSRPPDEFEEIRESIKTFEREAMEISKPQSSGKGAASQGLSRDQLIHLVGLLWKLSSAYKNYTKLLEQSLVDIRENMNMGEGERRALQETALNLDKLIDALQKVEDITDEMQEE
jgi:hypothetical protein